MNFLLLCPVTLLTVERTSVGLRTDLGFELLETDRKTFPEGDEECSSLPEDTMLITDGGVDKFVLIGSEDSPHLDDVGPTLRGGVISVIKNKEQSITDILWP